jgi:hypothetical protein
MMEMSKMKGAKAKVSNEVIIPTRVLTKSELSVYSEHIVNTLLETRNGLEAYVLVKQAEEVIEQLKGMLVEKALSAATGKEGEVLGCKYSVRRKVEYKYECPSADSLEQKAKMLKEDAKAIKKSAEKFGSYVDPVTGEVNTAEIVSDGQTLAITLPK